MDESTLIRAYHILENMLNSVGQGFGDDFEGNVAQENRPKIIRGNERVNLGDKANESKVKLARVPIGVEHI
jgi:hypothetical protein